jgi:hypothetical protein
MTVLRHKKSRPCPVCQGGEDMQRGREKRCHGWTSDDGEYAHCSREELAGGIDADPNGQTYAHRLHGPCKCGATHGEARSGTLPRDADIEATYDYRDERGNLLFQVVRKTGKRFLQRRPDGDGWIWQVGQVRRVPYRLAQLIAADVAAPVYVAEGEKDVEALVAAGVVATTNPGGAGKWSLVADVARPVLAGRDVVIVADNDETGKKHAHEVAESLRPVARSVLLVAAPSPHKDAADLLTAGGGVTDFVPMERPPLSPDWNLLDVTELAKVLPPVPWVCEPLGLAPGAISLVAGYGYSRKTMAMQSLGLSVASGRSIWGLHSVRNRGPFVHLDYEQGRRLTQERYQRLARGMGFELAELQPGALRVACMPRIYLDEKQTFDDLVRLVEGAVFVLVDSLRAAFPHADENSSEVRSYLDVLSRVSERTGAAFAVIHHARKPQQGNDAGATFAIRGSSALFDACQSVYVFIGEKNTPTTVHHQKDRIRGACLDDFGLDGEDVPRGSDPRWGLRVVHLEGSQVREMDAVEKAKEAVLRTVNKSRSSLYSATDIAERIEMRKKNVLAAVKELLRDGTLIQADPESPIRIGSREAS